MRRSILAAALLVGCSNSDNGDCASLDGVYLQTFDEVEGDCGPRDSELIRADADDEEELQPPEGCEITVTRADDNCRLELESVCDVQFTDGRSGIEEAFLILENSPAGKHVTGILDYELSEIDGPRVCESIYAVEATAQ